MKRVQAFSDIELTDMVCGHEASLWHGAAITDGEWVVLDRVPEGAPHTGSGQV